MGPGGALLLPRRDCCRRGGLNIIDEPALRLELELEVDVCSEVIGFVVCGVIVEARLVGVRAVATSKSSLLSSGIVSPGLCAPTCIESRFADVDEPRLFNSSLKSVPLMENRIGGRAGVIKNPEVRCVTADSSTSPLSISSPSTNPAELGCDVD